MKLNVDKCRAMHFGRSNVNASLVLTVPVADQYKDLGIVITNQLSFDEHAVIIVNKARRKTWSHYKKFPSPRSENIGQLI